MGSPPPSSFLGSEPKFVKPMARPLGAVRCTATKLVSDPNKLSNPPPGAVPAAWQSQIRGPCLDSRNPQPHQSI